jgi:hypothetical protein
VKKPAPNGAEFSAGTWSEVGAGNRQLLSLNCREFDTPVKMCRRILILGSNLYISSFSIFASMVWLIVASEQYFQLAMLVCFQVPSPVILKSF